MARPIAELERSFRQVGGGDLPARVPVRGDDELGRLALEFNRMCERLESAHRSLVSEQRRRQQVEDRLRNAQRLAGLGRLAAGLAHEIGTPLNVISGRTDVLLRHLASDERSTRNLKAISTQSERIVRIVRDMLDFARMKTPRRMPTSVAELVHTVVDLSRGELERCGVAVQIEIPEELPAVIADADQLQQVFMNLVVNARDAMTSGGTLLITAVDQSLPHPERGGVTRRHAVVSFEDTGAGIPEEHRERVFDPFFTTKEPGKGMGLGLAVSYGIVEEHGGWFDLESHPGQGTRVTVYLPIEGEPMDEGPTQSEVV
jgi:signal transduction histidine kinase